MGDELPPDELQVIEQHLARCARCRQEVEAMRQALVTAVHALPPVTPSTETKQRALQSAAAALAAARSEAPQATEHHGHHGRGRTTWGRWGMPSLALALVALLAVTGLGLERQARWRAVEAERALVAAWLTRDDVVSHPLPAPSGDRSPGTVMVAEDGVVLVVLRSTAPRGMGYQVWGETPGGSGAPDTQISLGLLTGSTVIRLDATAYTRLALSIEPRGGSTSPTTLLGWVPLGS